MQDFFVLGIIPGTNIQVSFETYAVIVGIALLISALVIHTARIRQQPITLFSPVDLYIETPVNTQPLTQSEITIIKPDQMAEGFDHTAATLPADTAALA